MVKVALGDAKGGLAERPLQQAPMCTFDSCFEGREGWRRAPLFGVRHPTTPNSFGWRCCFFVVFFIFDLA